MSREIKEAIVAAAKAIGEDGKGKNGLVGYMVTLAREEADALGQSKDWEGVGSLRGRLSWGRRLGGTLAFRQGPVELKNSGENCGSGDCHSTTADLNNSAAAAQAFLG
jgi:hypothetical protein